MDAMSELAIEIYEEVESYLGFHSYFTACVIVANDYRLDIATVLELTEYLAE